MDYLASEISMQSRCLEKLGRELSVMNQQIFESQPLNSSKSQRDSNNQLSLVGGVHTCNLTGDIKRIFPPYFFKFEGMQKMNDDENNEWRRYSVDNDVLILKDYLRLAHVIIKKDLTLDGCLPKEIAITLSKGEIMENEINIRLTKKNIDYSIILELEKVLDNFTGLKVSLFVLWTEQKTSSKKHKRKAISGKIRQDVFLRDNYTCQICGANRYRDGVKIEVDHKLPVSKGGDNSIDNLQTLCQRCNREKRDRTDLQPYLKEEVN